MNAFVDLKVSRSYLKSDLSVKGVEGGGGVMMGVGGNS